MSHGFEPLEKASVGTDWGSHSIPFPSFLPILWEFLRKEELTHSAVFCSPLGKGEPLLCSAFSPYCSALLVLYLPFVSFLSFHSTQDQTSKVIIFQTSIYKYSVYTVMLKVAWWKGKYLLFAICRWLCMLLRFFILSSFLLLGILKEVL